MRWTAVCSSAAGIMLIATACSSTSSSSTSTTAAAQAAPASASASASASAPASGDLLKVANTASGSILVDANGKAVYAFAIDTPGQSKCTGTCLQYWPIVEAPSTLPASLPGIAAKLGTLKRSDGASQLTVNNYPVYTYVGDTGPGTTKGQGKNLSGGYWWLIAPSGKWITTTASGGSSSSSGSGGGYTKGY